MYSRTRQTSTGTPALSALAVLLILIGAVLWKTAGASLLISFMTMKDMLTEIAPILGVYGGYINMFLGLALIAIIISEVLKPQFRFRGLPDWANIALLAGLLGAVIAVPTTGIGYLLREIAGLLLAIFEPAFVAIQQHANSTLAVLAASTFLYVIILRILLGKAVSSKYDMWTSGLFASGVGYAVGLVLGAFVVMTANIIVRLMAAGSILLFVIGLILIGTMIHEAISNLKIGPHDLAQLPAAIMMLISFKNRVLGPAYPYNWVIDVVIYVLLSFGVGAMIYGILFRNREAYVGGCAFCASLLAMLSTYLAQV